MTVDVSKQSGFVTLYAPNLRVTKQTAFVTFYPAPDPVEEVTPGLGSLQVTGHRPVIKAAEVVDAFGGRLTITGHAPTVSVQSVVPVASGSLRFEGRYPTVTNGTMVLPERGGIVVRGFAPVIYTVTGVLSSQIATVIVGAGPSPSVAASQLATVALAEPPPPPVRASQMAAIALSEIVPDVRASQVATIVLASPANCVTSLCQIWKITRRDGKVYRYTSLDRDLVYGGKVYKACGSMDPSASDNSSTMGSVGSQTLSGIITDNGITAAELFGGLFDDAYVTSDLVSYEDKTFIPRRLASGWIGKVTQGRIVHTLEVVSIGARIEQQALVRVVAPTCSHSFGDSNCTVNAEALKIPASVTRVVDRGLYYVSVEKPEDDGRQWANGRVRFLTGVNAGVVREFKSIDFDDGRLTLWALPGIAAAVGDELEIIPGCDLTREGGCSAYSNVINFGGFPDVPGTDSVLETPDAKI